MDSETLELTRFKPKKEGLVGRIKGFLDRRKKPPEQAEKSLTPYEEGEVEFLEVARIMREQGRVISENVYKAYEGSFQNPPGEAGGWEDNENNVMLIDGKTSRSIFVYMLPEGVKVQGYALTSCPRVMFHYKKTGDEWIYDGASVGTSRGYMEVEFGDEKDLTPGFIDFLRNSRIKMADMERALGRFLHPVPPVLESNLTIK